MKKYKFSSDFVPFGRSVAKARKEWLVNMAIDYSLVGERLKKARLSKKLTQENLAEELDVSIAFLSRIERGSSHVNLRRLNQLCELLDVGEGYILSGVSDGSKTYLDEDFKKLLEQCNSEKQKLIYNVVKTIVENEKDSN